MQGDGSRPPRNTPFRITDNRETSHIHSLQSNVAKSGAKPVLRHAHTPLNPPEMQPPHGGVRFPPNKRNGLQSHPECCDRGHFRPVVGAEFQMSHLDQFNYSEAVVKPVKRLQFGIFNAAEIVSARNLRERCL